MPAYWFEASLVLKFGELPQLRSPENSHSMKSKGLPELPMVSFNLSVLPGGIGLELDDGIHP